VNVTVLTAIGDPRREAELTAGLSGVDLGVTVVRRCVDLPDLLAAASAGLAQVAVLSSDLRRLDRAAVRRLADAGVAVVGLTPEDRPTQERLRGLGVARLLTQDSPVERVAAALVAAAAGHGMSDRALTPDHDEPQRDETQSGGNGDRGRVVAVWGAVGSPGRSTLALNLAAELAAMGHDVLCADLDTYGASLAQLCGLLDEGSGVAAVCRQANSGCLDEVRLRALAVPLRPGLVVLTGVSSPHRWPELRPSAIEVVLEVAKHAFGFTVLDTGFCVEQDEDLAYDTFAPRRNGATIAGLSAADTVIKVASADSVGIARLVRASTDLLGTGKSITVVNRVRRGVVGRGDTERQIALALGHHGEVADALMVPDDPATADAAVLSGRTWAEVASNSPARLAVRELARRVDGSGQGKRRIALRLRRAPGY
jgi:Flp pilus assembly CpaE family ATPase